MVCVNANKDWHSLKNNNNKKERERERVRKGGGEREKAIREKKDCLRAGNCNLKHFIEAGYYKEPHNHAYDFSPSPKKGIC